MERKLLHYYKRLHATEVYGTSAWEWVAITNKLIAKHHIKSLLDYGCGQSKFVQNFKDIETAEFDPAIITLSYLPNKSFDLITCFDVLEHIPIEELQDVMGEIISRTHRCLFNISCRPAHKMLDNNLNAHVNVKDKDWWISYLGSKFSIVENLMYREPQKDLLVFCYNK